MKEVMIHLKNIKKSFGDKVILNRISLTICKGEIVSILGKSGSGKSVMLKTIAGLITPDAGTLKVMGKNLLELKEEQLISLRRKVGYLFQEGALYDSMNVHDNLAFPLKRQLNRPRVEVIEKAIDHSLEKVGLMQAKEKMPSELSGGMKKRIALARTLILEPDIILYDEPTTGLDTITSKEISRLILEMRDTFGITSLVVSHDLNCVREVSDRVLIFHEGKIGAEGSYQELEKSEVPWIKAFFH